MSLPLRELGKHGHEVEIVSQNDKSLVAKHMADPDQWDVIIGERLHTYDQIGNWRKARRGTNRLVFENDDNIFEVTQENWAAYNFYKPGDTREAITAYAEWADLVTVTTEPLAEVFREINPNVAVLPNCVPDLAFEDYDVSARVQKRVGWVGGASHGRDIHMATPSVRRFINRMPDWDLFLGGNDYRPTFKVPVDRVHFEPWHQIQDDEELYFGSMDFDIGLAPVLETDFSRCKSAIKCIEYGARGIPVIASDATPYRNYIDHGVNGFLAKNDHEWLKYLSILASDDDLRLKMGQAARDKAGKFRISENWQQWETAYKSLWKENS